MFHRDYIVRIIQELGQAMAEIVGLKRLGRHLEALGVIDRTMVRMAGLGSALVNGLTVEQMLEMLRVGEYVDPAKLLALAELLAEEADIYRALGQPDAAAERSLRSLRFYLEALSDEAPAVQRGYLPRVRARLSALDGYVLPERARWLLVRFLEGAGQYGGAEDMLYVLLDAGEPGAEAETRAFYHRLLARPDADLEEGGLPREEVEEGLKELDEK